MGISPGTIKREREKEREKLPNINWSAENNKY